MQQAGGTEVGGDRRGPGRLERNLAGPAPLPRPLELTYLGRSTTLIGLDGVRILTDPSLPSPARFLLSRRVPPAELPEVDAVLISHGHPRHLDVGTLKRLPGSPRVLAGSAEAAALLRAGLERVEEMADGDLVAVGGIAIRAVGAQHRSLHAAMPPRHDPLGFVIEGATAVYFAGDALPAAAGHVAQGVDVALLPVAPVFRHVGHLSPTDAAAHARIAAPRVVVPIHWASPEFDDALPAWLPRREVFTPERLEADLRRAFEAAEVSAELRILVPGYSTTVEPQAGALGPARTAAQVALPERLAAPPREPTAA